MKISDLGKKGEKLTVKFLKKNKYKIIETNYKTKAGEIDIIARNKTFLVFTEVKTRTEGQMLEPQFSVDFKKRRKIFKTANLYMQKHKSDLQPRFDISEVIFHQDGKFSINYLENAFVQEEKGYAVF